jgi:hypothetical protein
VEECVVKKTSLRKMIAFYIRLLCQCILICHLLIWVRVGLQLSNKKYLLFVQIRGMAATAQESP